MDFAKSTVIFLVCMFMLGLGLMLLMGAAPAHEFYDDECCGGVDCKPVPDGIVNDANDGGVDIQGFGHIGPRDSRLRLSPDAHDHLCIVTRAGSMGDREFRCVYHIKRMY